MHSPLSFFIFVMNTFFFADLIPGIFRTPLKSSSLFIFLSLILFFALAHFFQSLFLFFGCISPLLGESVSLRISASLIDNSSLTFAAADAVARASLLSFLISLVLLLEWNTIRPASSPWCGDRAPKCSSVLWSGCSSSCGRYFGSRSPAQHVEAAAAATSTTELGHFNTDAFCSLCTSFTFNRVVFPFISLWLNFFPSIDIVKIAMTHLWSLPCGSCR